MCERFKEMVQISSSPILIAPMPFGKHKGMLFRDIPTDYLDWLQSTELDEDMAYTVQHYLRRSKAPAVLDKETIT